MCQEPAESALSGKRQGCHSYELYVKLTKVEREMCAWPTCQSAWMGLERRWQFQLNMKTLSALVMSDLGASFLLQRSCTSGSGFPSRPFPNY